MCRRACQFAATKRESVLRHLNQLRIQGVKVLDGWGLRVLGGQGLGLSGFRGLRGGFRI